MALLAAYRIEKQPGQSLAAWLSEQVFAGARGSTITPAAEEVRGFDAFLDNYKKGLPIEHTAAEWII